MPEIKCAVCGKPAKVRSGQLTCGMECGYIYRSRLSPAVKGGKAASSVALDASEKHTKTEEKWDIETSVGTRIKSLDDLIASCEIDTGEWEIERHVINKWEVGAKHPVTGKITVEPLYQVKAWLKRRHAIIAVRNEIEAMREATRKWAPRAKAFVKPKQDGLLAEIAIMDHHVGGLSWSTETGWDDWDIGKAIECYEEAFDSILGRAAAHKLSRILLVVGNDLLHTDNRVGTTEHGTPQDVDSRYQKGFAAVRELHCRKIEEARRIAPVDVFMIPGNHDMLGTWHLGDSLECWFRNYKDVCVNNAPTPRKYYEWGRNVLIGFDHGKRTKRDGENLALVMASEKPSSFQRPHKEFHVGHLHHLKVKELNGVRVRVLPTLTPPNAWASEQSYIGNMRSSEGFLWDGDTGLVGTVIYSQPPVSRHEKAA